MEQRRKHAGAAATRDMEAFTSQQSLGQDQQELGFYLEEGQLERSNEHVEFSQKVYTVRPLLVEHPSTRPPPAHPPLPPPAAHQLVSLPVNRQA